MIGAQARRAITDVDLDRPCAADARVDFPRSSGTVVPVALMGEGSCERRSKLDTRPSCPMVAKSSARYGTCLRMGCWCTWRMQASSVSRWMLSRRYTRRRSSSSARSLITAFGERSATHTTLRCPGCRAARHAWRQV